MSYKIIIPSKAYIRKNKEFLVSLVILMPYLDFYSLIGWMEIYFREAYIRAIVVYMMIIIAALIISQGIRNQFRIRKTEGPLAIKTLTILPIYILIVNAFKNPDANFLSVFLWFAIPIWFAMVMYNYCRFFDLNNGRIITYSLQVFALYLIVLIIYNIIQNKLFLDMSVRMDPRGGGAVIFGYTIAFLFALLINYRPYFSPRKYYFLMVIYSIGVIATQSRGAMWPVAMLWVISFLRKQYKTWEMVLILALFIIAVSIDWIAILEEYLPRFLNNRDDSRMMNISYLLLVFLGSDTLTKLFGSGFGVFFPYQKWILSMMGTAEQKTNLFISNGYSVLVQPHNSFIYMLIEGGVIATLIMILCVLLISLEKYKKNSFTVVNVMPFFLFVLLNNLDSIMFVEPGVAAIFWLLLLLYSIDTEKSNNLSER